MIGASGAISGVLGFYFVFFPRNQVRLLLVLPPFLWHVFQVPARIVLGIYLVLENVLPYLTSPSDVGVAHGAHIGGFVAGLAVAWFAQRRASCSGRASRGRTAEPASGDAVAARIGDGDMLGAAPPTSRCRSRPRAACSHPSRLSHSPRGCAPRGTTTRRSWSSAA